MLRHLIRKQKQLSSAPKIISRHVASVQQRKSSPSLEKEQVKEKWDLFAGVLVERLPIITKELQPIEKKFQELLLRIEFENSLKSDHELRHERDLKQAELLKKGEIDIDLDDATTKQTAQDMEDAAGEELKNFPFAPRITEEDRTNNIKSTNRKLDEILYLVVEEKFPNNKSKMILPQGIRKDGETMRQTAERVLQEKCGVKLDVFFYGNTPCGFYKFKYPVGKGKEPSPSDENRSIGAKIFFFRSSLRSGNVDQKVVKQFEWLDKNSLEKKITGTYGENIQKFLF